MSEAQTPLEELAARAALPVAAVVELLNLGFGFEAVEAIGKGSDDGDE